MITVDFDPIAPVWPRLTVTETEEVARMLDEAAERWPQDREHRATLLRRLAEVGAVAVRAQRSRDSRLGRCREACGWSSRPGRVRTRVPRRPPGRLAGVTVIDASALIAFLDPGDALHERALAGFIAAGPQPYGISPITHAEVLVGPTRAGTLESTNAAIQALGIQEIGLPADAARALAHLRALTALKLPDCCAILAAERSSRAIMTVDARLAAAAQRLGIELRPPAPA